jgi:hypothetical protein
LYQLVAVGHGGGVMEGMEEMAVVMVDTIVAKGTRNTAGKKRGALMAASAREKKKGKRRITMRAKSFWATALVLVVLVWGQSFNAWSAPQSDQQESYKKQIEDKIKELEPKVKELEKKAVEMKAEAKIEFEKVMQEVKEKEKVVKSRWEEVKKASAQQWNDAKSQMDAAMQSLEQSYQKAISRFK